MAFGTGKTGVHSSPTVVQKQKIIFYLQQPQTQE